MRAIAIALVCLEHVSFRWGSQAPHLIRLLRLGGLGVRVFFVLSGFLITHLLLRELDRTGNINLLRFYYRRTLRIFPAYYGFLLFFAVVTAFGWLKLSGSLLPAMLYVSDYVPEQWNLAHTWSLAVEEQFYLLWPALLLLTGKRRAMWCAVAVVVICPVVRVVTFHLWPHAPIGPGYRFDTQADALACGCLLAGFRTLLSANILYMRLMATRLFLVVPLGVLGVTELPGRYAVESLAVGVTVANIGIVLCIDWAMRHANGIVGRALNARPVVWIGVLSYSLYIWQQLFLDPTPDAFYMRLPLALFLALGVACMSYYLLERPFLRLRGRLEPRLFPQEQPSRVQLASSSTGTHGDSMPGEGRIAP